MTRPGRIALILAVALTAISQSPATEISDTSETPDWNLELALSTGAIAGIMGEYLYSGLRTLSYLDWQLMPLVTMGAGIEGTAPWGTRLGASATLPLTRISGTMTDSDYEDPLAPLNRTKVSYHTAIVDTYRDLDVWLSHRVDFDPSGSMVFGVGYRDRLVKMIAQDGTYDYGAESGDVTGVGITYEQHQRIPYVLVAAESAGAEQLSATVSFSPYVCVDALDHHRRGLLDFYDTVRGAWWFSLEIGGSFELAGRRIEIAGFGEIIPETRGNTYTVDYSSDWSEGTTSPTFTDGAGVSWWTAGLCVSLPFGW